MGILRSDVVSHSQLQPTGSVLLDGNSDYLSWSSHSSLKMGTSDFTLEAWVNITGNSDANLHQTIFMAGDSSDAGEMVFQMIRDTGGGGSALGSGADRELGVRVAGTGYYSGIQLTFGQWHHVACVRDNGKLTFFVDGVQGKSNAVSENLTTAFTQIGYRDGSYNGYFKGYISNARIAFGALYKDSFTPSRFELENVPGTVLLCCQSSSSATTAAVKPATNFDANGTAAASAVSPYVKKDIANIGPVFGDKAKFDVTSYMVPPGGTTENRGSGRGLAGGGYTPGISGQIYSVEIASQGTSADFGNLTLARRGTGAVSSMTRGVWGGGYAPGYQDRIDYVTIAGGGNAIDFGNLDTGRFEASGVSNNTRGVFGPSENPAAVQNVIQYITIATTGNATDFGDSTVATKKQASLNSPTRGIFAGGQDVPSPTAYLNIIDYITTATTGNATDFGDLTQNVFMTTGVSSATRGVRAGGAKSPSPANTNVIEYVTIASTGNATDYGDLTADNQRSGGMSNSTRGLFSGGATPNSSTFVNSIDFITIATTGNAADFGDYVGTAASQGAGCSDSHGGIS